MRLLEHREEALWLQALAALKVGKEEKAQTLLEEISTFIPLKKALLLVLEARQQPESIAKSCFSESELTDAHPLYRQLANPPYDKSLKATISHPEVFTAIFLATGWPEAAIQLHRDARLSEELPPWIAYCLTQALVQNRSVEVALNFAEKQRISPQLAFLMAELYLKEKKYAPALALLKKLAGSETHLAHRAAVILVEEYIRQGQLSLAREALTQHTKLLSSIEGFKLLSQINKTAGDKIGLEAIYSLLHDEWPEAKSYLAAKAYSEKNYKLAYRLTAELYRQNPNAELKENLKKIALAARQAA